MTVEKSKKLWADIEQVASSCKPERNASVDIGNKPQGSKFDARKPVSLSKLMPSRYTNYVKGDLQCFQCVIAQCPLNKEKVISEIEGNLQMWTGWSTSPPDELKRLMDGFSALREALTTDPQVLAASFTLERDQTHERIAATKTSYDAVEATCASMSEISRTFEERLASQELRQQEHTTRAQELRAQIKELNVQLEQVEEARDKEGRSKEHTITCLEHHRDRLSKATALKSELQAISVQDRDQVQTLEQTATNFTDRDDMGLSGHVRSLLDFFMSCSSES